MQTLPQNTPLRAPTFGTSPMAVAGPSAVGQPAGAITPADIFRVLRANLLLIVSFVVVGAIAGYFLNSYLSKYHSRYTASGLLEVKPEILVALRADGRGGDPLLILRAQRTQTALLRTDSLWSNVLRDPNNRIRDTQWFKSFDSPALAKADLARNFSAAPLQESALIQVQMTNAKPEDAKLVLEEVVSAHIRARRDNNLTEQDTRTATLNDQKNRLASDLRRTEEERATLAQQLSTGGSSPEGRVSARETELLGLINEQLQAQLAASNARAAFELMQSQLQNDQMPSAVNAFVENDPDYRQISQSVKGLEQQLAVEIESGRIANPSTIRLQSQLDSQKKQLEKLREELTARGKLQVVEQAQDAATQAQSRADGLQVKINEVKGELGEISNQQSKYKILVEREELLRRQIRDYDQQINSLASTTRTGTADVGWAALPEIPEVPSFPKLSATLSAAIMLGLALSVGIAFIREIADTTVRSPRDIARVGQLNLLGMIPHEDDDPQVGTGNLPLAIFETPGSMTAEQFRQVRTRLQQTIPLDNARTLLITSPSPGDGKSTVATNMAAGMALIGRKILLVDANFHRPELHKIFGMDNAQGLSDALNSPEKMNEVIKETKVQNLYLLPTGSKPTNASELLESQLLNDFVAKALAEFDHIIFDSGPILFTSDTVALAAKVDGVITVVRARSITRGILARTKDLLRQLKAENLGVVLNGVRAVGGGYYARNIKTYYEYSGQKEA